MLTQTDQELYNKVMADKQAEHDYDIPLESSKNYPFDIQIPFTVFENVSTHGFRWIEIVGELPEDPSFPTFEIFTTAK